MRIPKALRVEWESRLAEHGLGLKNSGEKTIGAHTPGRNGKWHSSARAKGIDANSGEMGRFDVVTNRNYDKEVPGWTLDDSKVRAVLLTEFPDLARDSKDRQRAARWTLVLVRYYRERKTASDIADELGVSTGAVEQIIIRAKAVGEHLYGGSPSNGLGSPLHERGSEQADRHAGA